MHSKEQNIAAKLSSVLGFPVNKERTASSDLCMKSRRELDKFEKFFEGLSVFKEKADQTLKEQREMTERGTHMDRVYRCHKSSPTSSSSARKKSTFNFHPSVPPKSLLRQKENVLPPELQVNNDLVVPDKPKRITSSIEVRKIDIALNKPISLRL